MTTALAHAIAVLAPPTGELAQPPETIDVFGLLGYMPTPQQQAFHDALEHDVVYGGAAGGGKTKALVADDLRDAIRYPGIRIGVFRRTYDELDESVIPELLRFDLGRIGARWVGSPKRECRFDNGSVIRYRYAEQLQDATRRQGGEYQKITVDERTLMPPGVVDVLVERLRTSSPRIPVLGLRSGTNPGGVGHGAVKAIVEATAYGTKVWTDEHGQTHRFIPARAGDNPHLDAGYQRVLDAIPDPQRRAAMRDGDWDVFSGQVFTSWRRDRHVVDRASVALVVAHAAAAALPRFSGVDWGWAAPWVYLTAQRDHDGRLWLFRELHGTHVRDAEQAQRIRDSEGLDTSTRFADPSMWKTSGAGPTTADIYAAHGAPLIKANNRRIPGWQRVHAFLADGPACVLHRMDGLETCPLLHVSDACTETIRTLPSVPHDTRNVEDVDTDSEDHWADALRYLLMGAGVPRPHLAAAPTAADRTETADLATAGF